jgi:hypothetical protein
MACRDRVIDVFVTKDSTDYSSGGFDDTFVTPVWSVSVDYDSAWKATVVNQATEWITSATLDATTELDVGDLVRIGTVSATGYTDYLTVVEKRTCSRIQNGVYVAGTGGGYNAITMHRTGSASQYVTLTAASGDPIAIDESGAVADSTSNEVGYRDGTYVCYRLNFAINCTAPVAPWTYGVKTAPVSEKAAIDNRHLLVQGVSASSDTGEFDLEQMFYPLYKVNKWLTNTGQVQCRLDHGVKALSWIKLIGYSVFNKRQVGFAHGHEMISDDWVALHIDEVKGGIISNNSTANGAFAVLHTGGSGDNVSGAIEFHEQDPQGLFTHYFDNHQSTIRNLNLKFLDRQGNAAHFGRIHLWFKLCVAHG